jgi:hypothetical protein
MSKTLISVLIILVVLVGGYFIISANKGGNDTTMLNTESGENEQTTVTDGKKMAFSEFVKQGGSYKCDVKQAMSDFENSGTVYIDGANVRGDFSTIAEGRTMETSFISKGGYSYMWSSAMNSGFKTKIQTETGASGTYSWDADQIGDYNCESWAAEESKFSVPANITFKEMGV